MRTFDNKKAIELFQIIPANHATYIRDLQPLHNFVPLSLLKKTNSAHMVYSGMDSTKYFVANLYRPDLSGSVIDETPFALMHNEITNDYYAGILQHGNWSDRTINMSKDFVNSYQRLGAGASWYIPNTPFEAESIYPLEDINIHQSKVFRIVVDNMTDDYVVKKR